MVQTPAQIISNAGFPVYLFGFSAIDSYLCRSSPSYFGNSCCVHILCGADLTDLARLFDNLRYPGAALADAAVDCGEKTWYFRCGEIIGTQCLHKNSYASFPFLEFYQNCKTGSFYDPNGIYPYLREIRKGITPNAAQNILDINPGADACRALSDAAMILAFYFPDINIKTIKTPTTGFESILSAEEQRLLLTGLLEAANPAPGFELLKQSGFLSAHWPEIAALDDVDQNKEYHPEGNAFKHTMEALRYRKSSAGGFETRLSLGLLLHDLGKPISDSAGGRRFDGHAELGARAAARFLERLEFEPSLVNDVFYLVKNHMLPAALKRLPLTKTESVMASPLFPVLMELYRCDESSSFKGLDSYYENSAVFQAYLRNVKNPYRNADGKKKRRREMYLR